MKRSSIRFLATIILATLFGLTACNRHADLKALVKIGNDAYRQYRTADYPTAKAAMLNFISELERRMPTDPAAPGIDMYRSDISVSYVRLAKLEEMNNGSEKENYMQKAVAICQQKKRKLDCSPEGLRKTVDDFDALPLR